MQVSLVIPAYNEQNRITKTINCVIDFLDKHFLTYEVIVVDDGSTDNTKKVLEGYQKEHVQIVCLDKNQGKGQAVKTGMSYAKGEYCFFTDADLPYRLESVLQAIDVFKQTGAQLVIGSRDLFKEKPDTPYPLYRKFMSKAFSLYINTILCLGIADTQCGFKGFTKDAAKLIFPMLTIKGFGFDVEMLYIARKYNLNVQRIPVNLCHTNDSSINIIVDSTKMALDTLRIRINDWKGRY